jgi:hypothetical protein
MQKQIDSRYTIRRIQDSMINEDNTLRFVVTDTNDMESYSLKLYMKGDQKKKEIYKNQDNFISGQKDCANNRVIINRLYGLPLSSTESITNKIKPKLEHILFPICHSKPSTKNKNGYLVNIMSLPEGLRLDKKCLKYHELNKANSCIPFVKLVAKGLLNAIHILNMGQNFFRHGNIYPHNIYLFTKGPEKSIYLDNMLIDGTKYDDITHKPFRDDFNMMADTLLNLVTGTNENVLIDQDTKNSITITGAYDIYHAVKSYFKKHNIYINLISKDLNIMGDTFKEGKALSKAEIEYRLKDSLFNFIYRLKCVGMTPSDQFVEISQAQQHRFIIGMDTDVEQWDSLPSDY